MIQLSNSVNQAILSAAPAVQTGNIFALPVVATQFTWQASFLGTPSAVSLQILTSLDGINFVLADSSTNTAGEAKTVLSSAAFIQARIDTITPGPCTLVTVNVIAEEGHDVIDTGGGAALPTDVLGKVLISQGAGVSPVFSSILTLVAGGIVITDPTQNANNRSVKLSVTGDNNSFSIQALNDNGTLKGTPAFIALGSITSGAHVTVPGTLDVSTYIRLREGTLASKSGDVIGNLANISDSTVNTIGAIITGGGTNHVLARWDGTNWICVGGPSIAGLSLPNNVPLTARNGANTADINLIKLEANDIITVGTAGSQLSLASLWGINVNSGTLTGGTPGSANYDIATLRVRLTPKTVAQLPTPDSTYKGSIQFVTDSSVVTFNTVVAGGGTSAVPVFCDGTNWRVG